MAKHIERSNHWWSVYSALVATALGPHVVSNQTASTRIEDKLRIVRDIATQAVEIANEAIDD